MEMPDYLIRVPLDMTQMTDRRGNVRPVAFDWENDDGETVHVEIDRVRSCVPFAEQKSGVVGDRYEVVIDGQTEYLYYSKLQPRTWYRLVPVSRDAYVEYYNSLECR
jgi:hypothetical protein